MYYIIEEDPRISGNKKCKRKQNLFKKKKKSIIKKRAFFFFKCVGNDGLYFQGCIYNNEEKKNIYVCVRYDFE